MDLYVIWIMLSSVDIMDGEGSLWLPVEASQQSVADIDSIVLGYQSSLGLDLDMHYIKCHTFI